MPELRSCASVEAALLLLLLLLGIDSGPRAVANVGSGFDLTNNTTFLSNKLGSCNTEGASVGCD